MREDGAHRPLVSLVALCYNQAAYLEAALESIRAQTYAATELVIIDDASNDDSVVRIREWIGRHRVKCTFIAHEENRGITRSLNEGLRYCGGSYVQLVACDDVLKPNKLERHVAILDNLGPPYALVCSDFGMIGPDGELLQERYFGPEFDFPEDPFTAILMGHMGVRRVIHSPTVLARAERLRDDGGYDESLLQEDFQMWLQLSSEYKVAYDPTPTVNYRVLSGSLSNRRDPGSRVRIAEERIKVIDKFLPADGSRRKALVIARIWSLGVIQATLLSKPMGNLERVQLCSALRRQANTVRRFNSLMTFHRTEIWKTTKRLIRAGEMGILWRAWLRELSWGIVARALFAGLGRKVLRVRSRLRFCD